MRSCQTYRMWKVVVSIVIVNLFSNISAFAQKPQRPFPQHVGYFNGSIKPNHISQNDLDNSVRNFYTLWKKRFIKTCPESSKALFGSRTLATNNVCLRGRDME